MIWTLLVLGALGLGCLILLWVLERKPKGK